MMIVMNEDDLFETELIGFVAVDSGQLMVCDPCYIKDDQKWFGDFNPSEPNEAGYYPFNYNGVCSATLSEDMTGQLAFEHGGQGAGVAFASGFGDGLYPVFATYLEDEIWGRRVAKVEIIMIMPETEE